MHIAGRNRSNGFSEGVHSLFPRECRKDERRDFMDDTAEPGGLQWKTVFLRSDGVDFVR